MFSDCIIMAGGSGTRLWPASNSRTPKQFLSIPGQSSFFKAAVDRAFASISTDGRLVIVAGESHVSPVMKLCSTLPESQRKRIVLIPEPMARNTAPALACACVYIKQVLGSGRTALVLTSDHIINPLAVFTEDALAADELARKDKLVVFGIPPLRPETGYGYIEAGERVSVQIQTEQQGISEVEARSALSFREKPDEATAAAFLEKGNFYWNSGMFGFSVDFMLEEFKRSARATIEPFLQLSDPGPEGSRQQDGIRIVDAWNGLEAAYESVEGISIDYAVAEKCKDTALVIARFEWLDIGSWDEYARFIQDTDTELYTSGSKDCFVDSDIPVALCGVEDLVVVVRSRPDGPAPSVLICKKGETQRVKEIVEAIKAAGRTDLL